MAGIDGCVCSPPFSIDQPCQSQTRSKKDYHAFTRGDGTKRDHQMETEGNLSNMDRDTFWGASRIIVSEVYEILRGSGVSAWIVKDYIRSGKRVDFTGSWARLLEQCGFVIVKRVKASLVKEESHPDLFSDEPIVTRTKRTSFFRRLYEKKYPHNAIDEEVVIFAMKPDGGEGLDSACTSPPFVEIMPSQASQEWHQKRDSIGKSNSLGVMGTYGTTPGQLGALPSGQSPESTTEPPTEVWQGCYDEGWEGLITPESFAHPAKISRSLIRRIFDEMFKQGWIKKGDSVVDPFGGVGTTSIEGTSRGLKVYSVELEKRFFHMACGYDCPGRKNTELCPDCLRLAEKKKKLPGPHHFTGNFDIHKRTWELSGDPAPVFINGDSRRLRELLGPVMASGCVTSPPFLGAHDGSVDGSSMKNMDRPGKALIADGYGTTEGQLGAMKSGEPA